ncbi:siderophore-interacting protein [Trinickia diaoshuihuensis]|uniref:siderophore-interacting protein n=1 Tax=Trinickia diaoshuihuensis TaxID=2292265 RepID=UPI000E27C46B|nr:siderophore-interacting protein [Trinickia diaoshuihuensis]
MSFTFKRVMHELRRRKLTVRATQRVTPEMLRVTFAGDDLRNFTSAAPDDHIKLFIVQENGDVVSRDYTPRRFDTGERTLDVDFALHDAGPATRWALAAKPGDTLEVGGPKGSRVMEGEPDWWLLVGDETALPAIGRTIEEAPAGTKVISLAAVTSEANEQHFETRAQYEAHWVHRPAERADDPQPFLDALAKLALPEGDGFVWIAAEAHVTRAVRDYMRGERKRPPSAVKATGYWIKGRADASEKFED